MQLLAVQMVADARFVILYLIWCSDYEKVEGLGKLYDRDFVSQQKYLIEQNPMFFIYLDFYLKCNNWPKILPD